MIQQTLFNILVCKDVFFPRYAEHFLSLIFNYYFLEFVRTLWCGLYHQRGLQTMAGEYFLFSQAIFLRPPLQSFYVNVHVQTNRLTKDVYRQPSAPTDQRPQNGIVHEAVFVCLNTPAFFADVGERYNSCNLWVELGVTLSVPLLCTPIFSC